MGLDSEGHCYVADISNRRIQVFTADGQFLSTIGAKWPGKGELTSPSGVAADEDAGVVCVTDLK